MSEWQPIETAPKDGTPVLLFHNNANVGESVSLAAYDPYYDVGGFGYDGDDKIWRSVPCSEPVEQYFRKATHWMPVPPPPQKQGRIGDDGRPLR